MPPSRWKKSPKTQQNTQNPSSCVIERGGGHFSATFNSGTSCGWHLVIGDVSTLLNHLQFFGKWRWISRTGKSGFNHILNRRRNTPSVASWSVKLYRQTLRIWRWLKKVRSLPISNFSGQDIHWTVRTDFVETWRKSHSFRSNFEEIREVINRGWNGFYSRQVISTVGNWGNPQ